MANYQRPKPPRFRKEMVPGGYEFIIPAKKNWFVLPFLCVWLTGWTLGGGAAFYSLTMGFEPFLLIWLAFWAVAWIFAATQIIFMLTGYEYIRLSSGDIELGYRGFLLGKKWLYRASEIASLSACDPPSIFGTSSFQYWPYPLFGLRPRGTICFDHGARTVYAGVGLDRAEAALIVSDLLGSVRTPR